MATLHPGGHQCFMLNWAYIGLKEVLWLERFDLEAEEARTNKSMTTGLDLVLHLPRLHYHNEFGVKHTLTGFGQPSLKQVGVHRRLSRT